MKYKVGFRAIPGSVCNMSNAELNTYWVPNYSFYQHHGTQLELHMETGFDSEQNFNESL